MGKKPKLIAAAPIHYKDRYNYVEIAATIIGHVHEVLGSEELLAQALVGGEVNVPSFASVLENLFDNEAIHELVNTQFGRGILFGMYLRITEESLAGDEQEVLDEMDV